MSRFLHQQNERVGLGSHKSFLITTLENKTEKLERSFSSLKNPIIYSSNGNIYNRNTLKYTYIFQNKNKLRRVAFYIFENLFHVCLSRRLRHICFCTESVVICCFFCWNIWRKVGFIHICTVCTFLCRVM